MLKKIIVATLLITTTDSIADSFTPSSFTEIIYNKICQGYQFPQNNVEYQDDYTSLKGLKGLHVNIDAVIDDARARGYSIDKKVRKAVMRKLQMAGLKYLDKGEMEKNSAQPQLNIYISYPEQQSSIIDATTATSNKTCCSLSSWSSFLQGVRLVRESDKTFLVGTWGLGNQSYTCADVDKWAQDTILNTVDRFLEDFHKANSNTAKNLQTS